MARLPDDLTYKCVLHGTLKNGGYIYLYRDAQNLGVLSLITRVVRHAQEKCVWMYVGLPEKAFDSFEELQLAVASADPEAIRAEIAQWPKRTLSTEGALPQSNKCRLCGEPGTHRFTEKRSWAPHDHGMIASVCEVHAQHGVDEVHRLLQIEHAARMSKPNLLSSIIKKDLRG